MDNDSLEDSCHGWTVKTLYVHFSSLLKEHQRVCAEKDKRYDERFEAQSLALVTANASLNKATVYAIIGLLIGVGSIIVRYMDI